MIQNLIARLTLDSTAFERGATRGRQSMRDLMADSNRTSQAFLGLTKAGLGLTAAAVAIQKVERAFTSVAREAAGFQLGMAKISTMLDKGDMGRLPQFGDAIKRMSIAYGEGTRALQQGATDIIGSAIAPAKAMKVLEASTIAAKGGFTDTSTVVKAVVGILNAYGMEAENATRVTDIMHAVVRDGVISFEDLAQNIGTVSSLAAVLDVDLEAVGASISTMTRAGINAEISITALRAVLNTFMNPTEEARAAAAELGFALDETSIRGGGLIEVMDKLRKANARQLEALMPNVRGLVGFSSMLKNASGMARDYQTDLHAAGTAQEAFRKVSETTQASFERLNSAWSVFKANIGDVAPMKAAADALTLVLSAANAEIAIFREAKQLRLDTMYKSLPQEQQESMQRAMQDTLGKPLKVYGKFQGQEEFDYTNMVSMQDETYARRLMDAYNRSAEVQARVRADIAATVQGQQKDLSARMPHGIFPMGPTTSPWEQAVHQALYAPSLMPGATDVPLPKDKDWKPKYEPMAMTAYLDDLRHQNELLKTTELKQRELAAIERARGAAVQDYNNLYRQTPELLEGETRAIKMLVEEQERLNQSRQQMEFNARFEEQIKFLQQEGQLLRLNNDEREAAALLMDAQNEAARMGAVLSEEHSARLREQVELLQQQQKIADTNRIIAGGLTDGMRSFTQAIIEGGDAMDALANSAMRMLDNLTQRLAWQPLENAIFKALSGGGGGSAIGALDTSIGTNYEAMSAFYGYHGGAKVGSGYSFRGLAPAALWDQAPRLHEGYNVRRDEFRAVLKRDETVRTPAQEAALRKAQSSLPTKFELHVHDESTGGVEVIDGGIEQAADRAVARVYVRDRLRRGGRTRGF